MTIREPDNSDAARGRRLRRSHRRVIRCRWCGRAKRRFVWQGVGPPSHAPGAWRLWMPMQDGEPCAREEWTDEGRHGPKYRRRVRRVNGRLAAQARSGRILRLLMERRLAAGATVPEGMPEEPKYLLPGRLDVPLPLDIGA
jgi:hypothetical protein